jgi:ABC-type transport system involved in multi-copper enzyme maturation permease subunit
MKKATTVPSTFQVVQAVGKVTFLEILRDKVLYNVLFCSLLILALGFLASEMSYVRPERIVLDFGLSGITLSGCLIAILNGSSLLGKEFDRRTIYVALSHPVTRTQFVLGKFAGLVALIVLNWVLYACAYLSIYAMSSGLGWAAVTSTLIVALFLCLIQCIVLASVSIFFSAFSTTSLSVIFSIGVYFIGHNISNMKLVAAQMKSSTGSLLFKLLTYIFPNLEFFNLGSKVTYGLPIGWQFVCLSTLYGIVMVVVLIMLAGFLVQSREV